MAEPEQIFTVQLYKKEVELVKELLEKIPIQGSDTIRTVFGLITKLDHILYMAPSVMGDNSNASG